MKTYLLHLFLIVSLFVFAGCGYRPSAKYARNILGEKVSTNVKISSADPANSVLIKDAVDVALIDVFHASLVSRSQSKTHLDISLSNPHYSPIQYDENGFIVAYRMGIKLTIKAYKDGSSKNYKASGFYDFAVEPNAIVTNQQRFNAIRYATQKALSSHLLQEYLLMG